MPSPVSPSGRDIGKQASILDWGKELGRKPRRPAAGLLWFWLLVLAGEPSPEGPGAQGAEAGQGCVLIPLRSDGLVFGGCWSLVVECGRVQEAWLPARWAGLGQHTITDNCFGLPGDERESTRSLDACVLLKRSQVRVRGDGVPIRSWVPLPRGNGLLAAATRPCHACVCTQPSSSKGPASQTKEAQARATDRRMRVPRSPKLVYWEGWVACGSV